MKRDYFLTIRPSLAAALMEKGFSSEKTINPWDTRKTAWKFVLSDELGNAVIAYYNEIGAPCPQSVTDYIQRSRKQ